jgi:hypothetical protein
MPPISYYDQLATLANLRKGQYLEVCCGIPWCRHVGYVTPGSLPSQLSPKKIRSRICRKC